MMKARNTASRFIHHWATELCILVLILLSVGMMMVEFAIGTGPMVARLEAAGEFITLIFVVELLLRFWVARKKRRFFQRYWIDIIAVLPLIRPLRIFRVVRILRLYRAGVLIHRQGQAFGGSIRSSRAELTGLAVGSLILVASAAMVLNLTEGPTNSDFMEFEDALWYAAFSLIGGEPIFGQPSSTVGRWTTLLLMIGGMTLFGMFVGAVSARMANQLSANMDVKEMDLDELVDHVIVCGWNRSGPTILKELFAKGTPHGRAVVLVTEIPTHPTDIPSREINASLLYHHHGDYTLVDVLDEVGIQSASIVILLRDELIQRSDQDRDARTVLAALTVERMSPQIYTVAELHSDQNEDMLRMAGVEQIVIGDWYAGVIIGSVARNEGLVSVLNEILTSEGNHFHTLDVPTASIGKTVADLHQELFVQQRAILISLEWTDENGRQSEVNPKPERIVRPDERMVVLAEAR
jgi:voltage-gated potassium channel